MAPDLQTYKLLIQGRVQGVGFRPFVYGLATQMGLTGWVNNSASGAQVVVTTTDRQLQIFIQTLQTQLPPPGAIDQLRINPIALEAFKNFHIRPSEDGDKTAVILPDLATCSACVAELLDPQNRRFQYPFINCTHCGPRYSIIRRLPYDRPHTTMAGFTLCDRCQREYEDPGDRRFHAQPNACPVCGPQLAFWDTTGQILAEKQEALHRAINALAQGKILAIKGVGGFRLWCAARNEQAVQTLRQRKRRPTKPLAVMYPHVEAVQKACETSPAAIALLQSSAAPIVVLRYRDPCPVAANVAPHSRELGVFLPHTPLQYLLLKALDQPLVATSGNVSGEPICIDNSEALERLGPLVDGFLVHDRPIVSPVDDSVVRIIEEKPLFLRRARGYAPLPITLPRSGTEPLLAVGGQYKNTVAIAKGNQVYMSPHLGDLTHPLTVQRFQQEIDHLQKLYDFVPTRIICDAHPDYLSHQYAHQVSPTTPQTVQHHYAHILTVMAEQTLSPPVLGIAWDGTGYGLDGTIWGGEFLAIEETHWYRGAHLRPFYLLGNHQAIQDPRRIALALIEQSFPTGCPPALEQFLAQGLSPGTLHRWRSLQTARLSPLTSSVGRLFDGVAALLGLIQTVSYEGEGALRLTAQVIPPLPILDPYAFEIYSQNARQILDWRPLIRAITEDFLQGISVSQISSQFHRTLIQALTVMTLNHCQAQGVETVVLSGGCFQNPVLLTGAIESLGRAGLNVHWPQQVPPNDGGLALGQLWAAVEPRAYHQGD